MASRRCGGIQVSEQGFVSSPDPGFGQPAIGSISQVIALVFPPARSRANYFMELFWGVWEAANEEGFALVTTLTSDPSTHTELPLNALFSRGDIDGVLLTGVHLQASTHLLVQLRQEPSFGSRPVLSILCDLPNCDSVIVDHANGGYATLRHFLLQGHRRILHFLTGNYLREPVYQQRLAGYHQACAEVGVDPADCLRPFYWRHADIPGSLAGIVETLQRETEVTAITALNDWCVLRIIPALEAAGFFVPGTHSIIGYDDTEILPDAQGRNMLSTVRVPVHDLAKQAAIRLIHTIRSGHPPDEPLHIPVLLVDRASTAPPQHAA
ncbi:MAG TPA: substrate-binding domain-containing protein [Armatimonadota bacterium]|jgi:LacI family transcriptional regulator